MITTDHISRFEALLAPEENDQTSKKRLSPGVVPDQMEAHLAVFARLSEKGKQLQAARATSVVRDSAAKLRQQRRSQIIESMESAMSAVSQSIAQTVEKKPTKAVFSHKSLTHVELKTVTVKVKINNNHFDETYRINHGDVKRKYASIEFRLARRRGTYRGYDIFVVETNNLRPIERIGFYLPHSPIPEKTLRVETARVRYWLDAGAKLSPEIDKILSSVMQTQGLKLA